MAFILFPFPYVFYYINTKKKKRCTSISFVAMLKIGSIFFALKRKIKRQRKKEAEAEGSNRVEEVVGYLA